MRFDAFSRYRASWQHSSDALLWADAEAARIVDANAQAEQLFGRTRVELIGMSILDLYPDDRRHAAAASFERHRIDDGSPLETEIQQLDGARVPVEIRSRRYRPKGGGEMLLGTFRDISNRRLAQREVASRNWALSAIHKATLAALVADNETELMEAICLGLATGDATTFIALAHDNAARSVTIVCSAGPGAAIVDNLKLSWADEARGNGPAGRAIRTGMTQVINDASASEYLEHWRPLLERFGIGAAIAIPLRDHGRTFGALEILSPMAGVFGTFEQTLFEDVARQLVLGLSSRRDATAFTRQLERSRMQEERVKLALEQTVAAIAATIENRDPIPPATNARWPCWRNELPSNSDSRPIAVTASFSPAWCTTSARFAFRPRS